MTMALIFSAKFKTSIVPTHMLNTYSKVGQGCKKVEEILKYAVFSNRKMSKSSAWLAYAHQFKYKQKLT